MPIHKFDYPILEHDTEQIAILMPDRKKLYKLPSKCVFPFLGGKIDSFALEHGGKKIAEFDTCTKLFDIYEINFQGEDVCLCAAPLGASASVQYLDFLIAYGAKHIISCGSCGTLHDIPENEILIPTIALRDEGTSYHYLPPSREVKLHKAAIQAIQSVASEHNVPYKNCKTWTTDGFYRSTKEMVEHRKKEGCDVVEMECSALAACAEFRNAIFGHILFTADTLAIPDAHDDRGWGEASWEICLNLALEAVLKIRD